MDASNAARQVEELLTLQDQWYNDAIEIKTPALFSRLKRVGKIKGKLEVKKLLAFEISCHILYPDDDKLHDLILSFEFPSDYPTESICHVRALSAKAMSNANSVDGDNNELEYKSCTAEIQRYLESFRGCECVEFALDWVDQNKETCLIESTSDENDSSSSTNNNRDGKVQCYVLRYNHLLSGPEHKKEKSMLDAAKKARLQGGLLWGTPGVVVVVPPSTENDAKEYGVECRNIGKRPDGVEEIWLPQTGLNDAGLGGLAQQKRGGKLQEMITATLRTACGGDEDLLRMVLGI